MEKVGFPLTPWPDHPVPVPAVMRFGASLYDGWVVFSTDSEGEPVVLPHELFLRELFDVDLADREDVVAFINEYGTLSGPYGKAVGGLLDLKVTPETPRPAERINTHVLDVIFYLKTARLLARHWVASLESEPVLNAWRQEELDSLVSDEEGAWGAFVDCLNAGLGALRVRVERPVSFAPEIVRGEPVAGLYTGLCVQLFNHLMDEAAVRRCANETCGRAFVRQQGGGASRGAGQFRTEGVVYCSPSCGNAQWQREHRRRKRAERNKP